MKNYKFLEKKLIFLKNQRFISGFLAIENCEKQIFSSRLVLRLRKSERNERSECRRSRAQNFHKTVRGKIADFCRAKVEENSAALIERRTSLEFFRQNRSAICRKIRNEANVVRRAGKFPEIFPAHMRTLCFV